jgi:hypothetical protein
MKGINVVPYQARPYKHFCAENTGESQGLPVRFHAF